MYRITFLNFPELVYAHSMTTKWHQFYDRRYTFLEIVYITQGALHFSLDGTYYHAETGDCLMIPPATVANCHTDERFSRNSHFSVGVRCEMEISEDCEPCQRQNAFSFVADTFQRLGGHKPFIDTFEKLIKTYNQNATGEALGLYLQLCAILGASSQDAAMLTSNGTNSIYARKIMDYVDNNYAGRIFIPTIAKYLSITPEYASSLFKEATKETIISYANKKKIEKAKRLLQDGGISIQYVASMVGIENTSYFSRLFKKYEGISPSEFKRGLQREYIDYHL